MRSPIWIVPVLVVSTVGGARAADEVSVPQAGAGRASFGATKLAVPIDLASIQSTVPTGSPAQPGLNSAQLLQVGRNNNATISQAGGGNSSFVLQQGSGNVALVSQVNRSR